MSAAPRVALVTGANRGLGLETARQLHALGWTVALCARDPRAAEDAAARLGGDRALPLPLDVRDAASCAATAASLRASHGRLDALVQNAGVILDGWEDSTGLRSDPATVAATFDTNALGALRVAQAFLPLLLEGGGGALVHVSSGMGALSDMGGGMVAYRLSKSALNALTRVLHAEHRGQGLRVNSVCPGWVRTDMGGASAPRSVEEGARGIVWAATLPPDGPSGGFFRDGRPIDW
jgi:NAD(P)-dependent dehydrogenase (short-subunit alcohol dehydrogenase family)